MFIGHMSFNFRRRYGLFTYAQCGDLDPWAVSNHFSDLRAECIIGREDHADGGIHLHAFVDFGKQYRSRSASFADVEGRHPNILPIAQTPEKTWDYATKDGDVVAGGLERPNRGRLSNPSDGWNEIINAESREQFFELLAELEPKALCVSFPSLCKFADWRFRIDRTPYRTPVSYAFDTSGYPELDDWVRENLDGHQPGRRGRSLILVGPSRLGKTVWARSLRQEHTYYGGLFCLDEYDEKAEYAVFDDIQGGLEFFHAYKFWLGHQTEFFATDKYKGKKLIQWGKPAIWCSNTDPRMDKGADADWLDENCTFVFINTRLF